MSAHSDSAAEIVLAVDAGGSKAVACVARSTSSTAHEILGRGRASGANPLSIGLDRAVEAVSAAAQDAWNNAKLPVACADRAVLSIAGAADPAIAAEFARRVHDANLAREIAMVSDVLPVLVGGTDHGVGIALIAGTGSVAYGSTADGRAVRCGGWGYLLGDDGSGYAVGRSALRLALADFETNSAPRQPLALALLNELHGATASDLIKSIYTNTNPRAIIASLAPRVAQAAEANDPAAREILEDAGRELAQLAKRTAKLLHFDGVKIQLALAGGMLVGSKYLQDAIAARLKETNFDFDLRVVADPLVGCLRLADSEFRGTLVEWR